MPHFVKKPMTVKSKKKPKKLKQLDRSDPYDPDPIMPFMVKKDIANDRIVKETDVFEGKTKGTKRSRSKSNKEEGSSVRNRDEITTTKNSDMKK